MNILKNAGLTISILAVALTLIGIFYNHSNIPYWDMWDGYLNFYLHIVNGNYSEWFAQHNEHKIFLSRLLFFIDIVLFNSQSYFLLFCNIIFLILAAGIFINFFLNKFNFNEFYSVYFLIVCFIFSWIQKSNLVVGFQVAFILAQIVPLLSFYFLYMAISDSNKRIYFFILSSLFGFLSIYTLISGIFILPLLMLLCYFSKLNNKYLFALLLITILSSLLYFYNYQPVAHHGSINEAVLDNPLGILQYIFLYFGGPFYYFFGKGDTGILVSSIMGAIFIIASLYYVFIYFKNSKFINTYGWLISFIAYVGATAFVTAGGRLIFGATQALSSRYMTPVIFAWICIIIITIFHIYEGKLSTSKFNKISKKLFFFFINLLILLIFVFQFRALSNNSDVNFEKDVAALSIKMKIKDMAQIQSIYPNYDLPFYIQEEMVNKGEKLFDFYPFNNLSLENASQIEKELSNNYLNKCIGELNQNALINQFTKVSGWMYSPDNKSISKKGFILDEKNKLLGFVLTGKFVPNVSDTLGKNALKSGFKGYMISAKNEPYSKIKIVSPEDNCEFITKLDLNRTPIFNILNSDNVEDKIVSSSSILATEWVGQDYYSVWSGIATLPLEYNIYGSFSYSDEESGSITIKVKRGQGFYFRSEPASKIQVIQINDGPEIFIPRDYPPKSEWLFLEFSDVLLPDVFDVKITDKGAGWGEWSAIGLKK